MKKILVVTLPVVLAGNATSTVVLAADKQACIDAYTATQTLKKAGKLVAARKQALVCAQDGCPNTVRDECTGWVVELEKSTPTLVFAIIDAEGKDVTDATVYVDGEKVPLDGKGFPVDPGLHKVRVEREGVATLEQDVVANEGTKSKTVTFKFGPPSDGPKKSPDPVKDPETPAKGGDDAPTPTATWVLLGLGGAGLVGFTIFGLSGNSKKQALDDSNCKPACAPADVDAAKRSYLLADVSLGVSVVSFATAFIVYAMRGSSKKEASAVSLDVAPRPRGGFASLSVAF